MFAALFQRAQVTVDNAIGQALSRAVIAVPFLVAGGFATAALTVRLTRDLGSENGYLVVAAIFAVMGLITAAFVRVQQARRSKFTSVGNADAAPLSDVPKSENAPGNAAVDNELFAAALTAIAPIALPNLLRNVLRNLPMLLAIAAAIFVITRQSSSSTSDGEAAQSAP